MKTKIGTEMLFEFCIHTENRDPNNFRIDAILGALFSYIVEGLVTTERTRIRMAAEKSRKD